MVTPQSHHLHQATLFTSRQPCEVTTILGSCVAVCLWDRRLQIGGINHYVLPLWNGEGLATPKYGNIANQKLIGKLVDMGSSPADLIAKVFGGAQQLISGHSVFTVGERNVQIALEMLKEYNIPVASMHTGGKQGRHLKFIVVTGEVWMKLL